MNSNINKKKINLFLKRKFIKYVFIIILFLSFFISIYYEIITREKFYNIIQEISEKFEYQLKDLEINSLNRVDKYEVLKITNKFYNQSIFLIPLDEISNSLHKLRWVKNVNLSTNFINKINIEIFEYEPIGLLFFNNELFYFSNDGKIIDKIIGNNNENLIIFHGKHVLKEANSFLNTLNKLNSINMIKEAYYINERRWDVKLHNEILLNLSEKNIKESINNYNKLIYNFDNSDILKIKSIDLRNNEKGIISFK